MAAASHGEATYALAFDEKRAVLVITASGFWDRALQERFADELIARMRGLRDKGQRFCVLADARDFPVQSVSISLGFMGIVRRLDKNLLVPTAIVTTSVLVRLQGLRVFVAPHIRMFRDLASAHAWLGEAAQSGH